MNSGGPCRAAGPKRQQSSGVPSERCSGKSAWLGIVPDQNSNRPQGRRNTSQSRCQSKSGGHFHGGDGSAGVSVAAATTPAGRSAMNLRLDQVSLAYLPGRLVLREVSLKLEARHVTGLFGPNGSGKSTLLRCLNGSLRPQSGQVWLEGRPVADLGSREAARVIAVVSQDTPRSLPFTALELVLLGRYPHGEIWREDSAEEIAFARECLSRLDVGSLAERPFDELSACLGNGRNLL